MGRAGRPFGSRKKPQFRDFISESEVKELVKVAKQQAKTKPELLKFVLEQVFGKAPQPLGNEDGQPLLIKFDDAFKNAIT